MEYISKTFGCSEWKGCLQLDKQTLLSWEMALRPPFFPVLEMEREGPWRRSSHCNSVQLLPVTPVCNCPQCYLPISQVGTAGLMRLYSHPWPTLGFSEGHAFAALLHGGGPGRPLRSRTPNHNHFRASGLHAPWFRADRVWTLCQHLLHRVTVST